MKRLILLLIFFTAVVSAQNQNNNSLLQAGPMVGYSQMREVMLWVQTTKPAKVKIVYWDKKNPSQKFETKEYLTSESDAFTAHLIADKVEPGIKYNYALFINGKKVERPYILEFQTQKLWQWREDPPEFSFAVGSCLYINESQYDRPGKPYGSDYEILTSLYDKHPDFMIWLGDNLYFREPDWSSWTGIVKRYTHDRSLPELQPVLGSMHNYAIWDDHDYGSNDADRGFWNKEQTLKAFKLFWANPSYGINGNPGITTFFQWGDVDFFLMDDRYYRTPNDRITGPKTMLGKEQFEWLIDNLVYSKAPFKIIVTGGQVLNPVEKDYLEIYNRYPEEKQKLLNTIKEEGIEGVIFITGDRHHSEVTKLERDGAYPLYDFTISSLTAGVSPGKGEANYLRVPGTLADEHNFAIFTIAGKRKNRILTCTDYDKDGKQIWSISINENELKNKK
ncbi:alkaline phosphatase [Melioribacteraceae bacterium 4301-Me]|uniref:alkaline phosphatase D family protein n=1 Tax=Pyranulibacter aquaticus TaxID=3163344 RepID=UPI003597B88D